MVNTASKSYVHPLSITEKVCPGARHSHPLLDKTKFTGVEHRNPSLTTKPNSVASCHNG